MEKWTLPDDWPGEYYSEAANRPLWLRVQRQFPESENRSVLVAHNDVPFIATLSPVDPLDDAALGELGKAYLQRLVALLEDKPKLKAAAGLQAYLRSLDDFGRWLPVWPPLGKEPKGPFKHRVASWNLSRAPNNDLPATVVLALSEAIDVSGASFIFAPNLGLRLPILIEKENGDIKATIRSVTAQLPKDVLLLTEVSADSSNVFRDDDLVDMLGALKSGGSQQNIVETIADLEKGSFAAEDIFFIRNPPGLLPSNELDLVIEAKARERVPRIRAPLRVPRIPDAPLGKTVTVRTRLTQQDAGIEDAVQSVDADPAVTHAVTGRVFPVTARVFRQSPPDRKIAEPEYLYTDRRPARRDDDLDRFRENATVGLNTPLALEDDGFRVRNCPEFVIGDGPSNDTKTVDVPANGDLPPRSDDFSALSAYWNARRFFRQLKRYGIDPQLFPVATQTELQVFYRFGIAPGPGKDGRTINAQVTLDRPPGEKPVIRMNLALANLNRWRRDLDRPAPDRWAEPLGIAMDGRWIMHEFGHYLTAARIGKLEFEFVHSVGDALAAISADPRSALSDPAVGAPERMRGYTYPFVFTTRRHDRTAETGWAWYGLLNRSVVDQPPGIGHRRKGYLTEQILSSTLFHLYRGLGGDTMLTDTDPDIYIRRRAAHWTLFMIVRAIQGLVQSPSDAEMLELALEEADLGMATGLVFEGADTIAPQLLRKPIRWVFERQGMFPEDPARVTNGPGLPPPVDLYIGDRRPESVGTTSGEVRVGPGSYTPVSLAWDAGAGWTIDLNTLVIGNRGRTVAQNVTMRAWLGKVTLAAGDRPDVNGSIAWLAQQAFQLNEQPPDSLAGPLGNDRFERAIAEMQPGPAPDHIILFELSTPFDRANTDPFAGLSAAVTTQFKTQLPQTPRALIDLVANDNNLGVLFL